MYAISKRILLLLMIFMLVSPVAGYAQETRPAPLLAPIGGGYADVYAGLVTLILERASSPEVRIAVLPTPYTSNAEEITPGEREVNLTDAERRRYEIEQACQRSAPTGVVCSAFILPVFTRADASDPAVLGMLQPDPAAIFILGGDQGAAMQALVNTPLENVLLELYQNGTLISGTSAGGGMLSAAMIADYSSNFGPNNALSYGAANLWYTDTQRGLSAGVPGVIFDQHFFQRSRLARLLEAISRPDSPAHIGVGIDAYTGLSVRNQTILDGVFGLYSVAILDAETYHAAQGVQYQGSANWLRLRNVLVHLLSPGEFSYDIASRSHSLSTPPEFIDRPGVPLRIPENAGALYLLDDANVIASENLFNDFLAQTDSSNAPVAIVVGGYTNPRTAERQATTLAEQLNYPSISLLADETGQIPVPYETISGIIFSVRDVSLVNPPSWIRAANLDGTPVMLIGQAVGLAGQVYANHGPTPVDAEDEEIAVQKSFILGRTDIQTGLGLLNAHLHSDVIGDNRWGRLFSLGYANSNLPGFGLTPGVTVIVDQQGAHVRGNGVVISLDLSSASLGAGTNDGLVIANGLIDVFPSGETISYQPADITARFDPPQTPVVAVSPTATDVSPTPTATVQVTYTSTPADTPELSPAVSTTPQIDTGTHQESVLPAQWIWLVILAIAALAGLTTAVLRRR